MIIAPSILSADFTRLKDQIQVAERAGADWFHLDVMDGHFVPNITFGPLIVEAVRALTTKPLDVHLMIENPERYVKRFRDAGADIITIHVEATHHLDRLVNLVKDAGAKVGVALKPATSISTIDNIVEEIDLILAMTVNPGFGGQTFIPTVLPKVQKLRETIDRVKPAIDLEVDGGLDSKTCRHVVEAGANVLVAGSAIFGSRDISGAIRAMRASITA